MIRVNIYRFLNLITVLLSAYILCSISNYNFFNHTAYSQDMGGKDLFLQSRCANCHTIGRGKFVGPDLYKVGERYSREDIIKWMVNSQQIYSATGKMPMNEGYPPMDF